MIAFTSVGAVWVVRADGTRPGTGAGERWGTIRGRCTWTGRSMVARSTTWPWSDVWVAEGGAGVAPETAYAPISGRCFWSSMPSDTACSHRSPEEIVQTEDADRLVALAGHHQPPAGRGRHLGQGELDGGVLVDGVQGCSSPATPGWSRIEPARDAAQREVPVRQDTHGPIGVVGPNHHRYRPRPLPCGARPCPGFPPTRPWPPAGGTACLRPWSLLVVSGGSVTRGTQRA
jgi:hypothetical protein